MQKEGTRLPRSSHCDRVRSGGSLYHPVSQHHALQSVHRGPARFHHLLGRRSAVGSPCQPLRSARGRPYRAACRIPGRSLLLHAKSALGPAARSSAGLLPAVPAALPWSLLMLGLLIASVRVLWKLFGPAGSHFDWLGYCFPPALFCVILGQTSILMLFGLVLFLRLHKTSPFVGGRCPLVLLSEAPLVSSLRRRASGVDLRLALLSRPGRRIGRHGRQLHHHHVDRSCRMGTVHLLCAHFGPHAGVHALSR